MDTAPDNPPEPLDRRPDEPSRAHTALCDYAALGPGRSIDKLLVAWAERRNQGDTSAPPTARRNTLVAWSVRHDWPTRVAAYDEGQARAQLAQREAERSRRAVEIADRGWEVGRMAIDRAHELLAQTGIETTQTEETVMDPETGRRMVKVTIREAPKGSYRDIAALLKVGLEAARLAAGEATDRLDVQVRLRTPEELERMTVEEKRAYLRDLARARAAMGG
jgi:hypothetical protein